MCIVSYLHFHHIKSVQIGYDRIESLVNSYYFLLFHIFLYLYVAHFHTHTRAPCTHIDIASTTPKKEPLISESLVSWLLTKSTNGRQAMPSAILLLPLLSSNFFPPPHIIIWLIDRAIKLSIECKCTAAVPFAADNVQ